jgi:hypothetical protein
MNSRTFKALITKGSWNLKTPLLSDQIKNANILARKPAEDTEKRLTSNARDVMTGGKVKLVFIKGVSSRH